MTMGVVFQQFGWHVVPRTHAHDGRRSLNVALASTSQIFHLDHVATIGTCRGVATMPALAQQNATEILAWCRGRDVSNVVHYTFQSNDVTTLSLAHQLA